MGLCVVRSGDHHTTGQYVGTPFWCIFHLTSRWESRTAKKHSAAATDANTFNTTTNKTATSTITSSACALRRQVQLGVIKLAAINNNENTTDTTTLPSLCISCMSPHCGQTAQTPASIHSVRYAHVAWFGSATSHRMTSHDSVRCQRITGQVISALLVAVFSQTLCVRIAPPV